MAPNIGVNVIEVDGRAAPTIVGAPISVTAFLLKSRRGPVNKAIPLRGLSDLHRNFGGVTSGAFGAHAVRGFFENGGTEAWAVRIASSSAVPARATLNDSNGTGTLRVTAGVRGEEDPGSWANDLRIAVEDHPRASASVPAQVRGTQAEPFAVLGGQSLSVSVNGGSAPVVVAFLASDFADPAAATADEVTAAINSRTSAFRAAVSPTREIVLSSGIPGTASQLVVGSTAGATALGFTGTVTTSWELTGVDSLVLPGAGGLLVGSAARIETRAHMVGDSAVPATQVLDSRDNRHDRRDARGRRPAGRDLRGGRLRRRPRGGHSRRARGCDQQPGAGAGLRRRAHGRQPARDRGGRVWATGGRHADRRDRQRHGGARDRGGHDQEERSARLPDDHLAIRSRPSRTVERRPHGAAERRPPRVRRVRPRRPDRGRHGARALGLAHDGGRPRSLRRGGGQRRVGRLRIRVRRGSELRLGRRGGRAGSHRHVTGPARVGRRGQ